MAKTLSSIQVTAQLKATVNNAIDASGGANTAACVQGDTFQLSLTTGTGADQADRAWEDQNRSLASGATEDLDLYDLGSIDIGGGAGNDALGQAFTNAELVAILVRNRSTSAGTLNVGGKSAVTAFNSVFGSDDEAILSLPPGGIILLACPDDTAWAIADTSNHLLQMEASGGDVTYDVAALFRSA